MKRWYQIWLEWVGQPKTTPTKLAKEWRRSMSDWSSKRGKKWGMEGGEHINQMVEDLMTIK